MTVPTGEDAETDVSHAVPTEGESPPAVRITGCILARDEEARIEGAIACLTGWTDQVIVLDNGSGDRTAEIARASGALVVPVPPAETGACFDAARNRAVEHAVGDWLFYLDADERVPERLGSMLRHLVTRHGGDFEAAMAPFKHYFCGRWMRHCGWWPGYTRPQLLKKGFFAYRERLHAGVEVKGRTVLLPAADPALSIDHHSFGSVHHYLTKLNRYTDGEAESLRDDGQSHSWQAMLASFVHDWQVYYDRGEGHRDGTHGFTLSFLSAFYRFAARAKLWDLRCKRGELVNPTEPVPGSVGEAIRFMRKVLQTGGQHWLRPHAVPTLERVPPSWLAPKEVPPAQAESSSEPGPLPAAALSSPACPISACVVARDEAHLIGDALRSLSGWTRRIIFVDNDSGDDTAGVAKGYTDHVLSVRGVHGHLEVVRAAAAEDIERLAFSDEENPDAPADNRWLLFLDADERIPPQLAEALPRLVAEHGQEFEALFLPFKWFFCGKWIRHSGKWPGYKAAPQMVKGGAYHFNPHVHWGGEITGRSLYLPADDPDLAVLHYSVVDVAAFLYKENRSTTQEVPLRDAGGWDHSWRAQMAHFILEWQDAYDTCRASEDGTHGFILAFLQGMSRYFVRAKLWDARQQQGLAPPEQLPTTVAEVLDFWEQVMDEGADVWLPRLSLAPRTDEAESEASSTPAHLGGHFGMTNMDEPILDYLIERFGVKSLVDLGCGPGGMVEAARRRGLVALGIDGDASVTPDILHDFTTGPLRMEELARDLPRPLLVWCVEFVEHVEAAFVPHFTPVFAQGDVVFLTHALPGQGGHHHVNERSPDYWTGVLATLGLVTETEATMHCREVASNQYTQKTGMIFVS